jgi:hypothetical protein
MVKTSLSFPKVMLGPFGMSYKSVMHFATFGVDESN